MSRHSKNNTAGAYFTYEERQKLDYGTKEARIGRDSMRPCNACHICLHTARDPLICEQGHLSCRECSLESILNQKEEIAKKQRGHKDAIERKRFMEETKAKEEKEKVLKEFSRQQEMSSDAIMLSKKRAKIEGRDLASYWIPSKTPQVTEAEVTLALKNETLCMATEDSHPITMKRLIPISFSKSCPSCVKEFSNSSQIIVSTPCGHLMCKACWEKVGLDKEKRCFICSTKVEKWIEMYKEGTGFSGGGGKVLVRKYNVAFQ